VIRRAPVAALVLAAVGLAGCSTFDENDAAAAIDGAEVSQEQFEDTLTVLAANSEDTGIEEDFDTGSVAGETGRQVLAGLVRATASQQYLADHGEQVTDADRDAAQASLPAWQSELPSDVADLVLDFQAAGAARARIAAQDAQARYEESPSDLGVMCVRHIVVDSEEEAQDVLAELEGGADFADLAAERSTEQAAASTGGALTDPQTGAPCLTTAAAIQSFDAAFVAGATAAVPGEPTEPVQSPFGWHVILARPYSEVEDSVLSIYGARLFAQYLQGADVTVDPRYGRWDAESGSIVTLA
jgi:peptidyl-prolyl cis-trans isomerase C